MIPSTIAAGDPSIFAIESQITTAYSRLSHRALGYFNLIISGVRYGVHAPDATLLACSFEEVGDRISRRGSHCAPFAHAPADALADAILKSIYSPAPDDTKYIGLLKCEFAELAHSTGIHWAPDGDEAFDDRSHVLQFDVGEQVRLVGFKHAGHYQYAPSSLTDVWLESVAFYSILEQWRTDFLAAWNVALGST